MMKDIKALRIGTGRVYELIALVTGFTLMAYELVASRILAPTIGSSTYVWTSVIGVIIAALSIGYALGGWLADKRVARSDIAWLLLASSVTIAGTILFSDSILQSLSQTTMDTRLKGVVASLMLFMPTSLFIGMISPYLVRMHTDSITVAGRSVASLSALNAIGGILGTFSVGFIFFSYLGSEQTLGLLVILMAACSWLIAAKRRWALRLVLSLCVGLVGLNSLFVQQTHGNVLDIDTPTAHYEIFDTTYNGRPLRALAAGPQGFQSGVYLDDHRDLAFAYTQEMADMVAAAPQKDRILMLGGGAYTLPQHLGDTYPNSTIDVVEIDPALESIANKHFFYDPPANVHHIAADGRAYIETTNKTYDIILVDIYSDVSVPFAAATVEYTAALKSALTPKGSVIANIIGADTPACGQLLRAVHTAYDRNFNSHKAFPLEDTSLKQTQNIVTAYSNASLDWLGRSAQPAAVTLPKGAVLKDNFAPIERLGYQCWQS
jgi:predicted membrane-bound spermidine synthase